MRRGIKILNRSHLQLEKNYSLKYDAKIKTETEEFFYKNPDYILLTEGIHSITAKKIGFEYESK